MVGSWWNSKILTHCVSWAWFVASVGCLEHYVSVENGAWHGHCVWPLCVLFVLCENCIVDASIFFFCNAIFCCCVFVHLMILPDCASMRCPLKWVVCVVCVLCELL